MQKKGATEWTWFVFDKLLLVTSFSFLDSKSRLNLNKFLSFDSSAFRFCGWQDCPGLSTRWLHKVGPRRICAGLTFTSCSAAQKFLEVSVLRVLRVVSLFHFSFRCWCKYYRASCATPVILLDRYTVYTGYRVYTVYTGCTFHQYMPAYQHTSVSAYGISVSA